MKHLKKYNEELDSEIRVEEENVEDTIRCHFYDDGCGNGSYISSQSCGPPTCNLTKASITPKCDGKFTRCEVDGKIAQDRTTQIQKKKQEIKDLNKKI